EAVAKLKTQEQAMTARVAASEQLSSEIVESISAGLLVVDRSGRIDIFNAAARQLLAVQADPVGRDYHDVLAAVRPLAGVIDECLTTAVPIVRRAVEITGAGRPLHFGVTASPLRDAQAPRGVICLFSDLTAVMDLEERLRMKETLARLGELTAGIAHEFRNGLATIHGYGRLLDLERLPPDLRPYVSGIREETEALGEVVTNFLNFAKPTRLVLAPVDMRAIAERAADEIRSEVRQRGGKVVVRGEYGRVDGDEVLLRQAFSNLCRNALEACTSAPVPPHIVIEGTPDPVQQILRVSVTDNGPGVAPAVAGTMFRPFFTTKPNGIGLGLALVQKIVVTHNGRVTAGSADGGGARLMVTLPLRVT
ncbi:MAG TPA: ATP-binding protein, partial [Vicinamibacterales bacterium]|nr:ATP-binding protein [Vicinamibacterales bacterium]